MNDPVLPVPAKQKPKALTASYNQSPPTSLAVGVFSAHEQGATFKDDLGFTSGAVVSEVNSPK